MTTPIVLREVDWYATEDATFDGVTLPYPYYRTCDCCYESATEDVFAGKAIADFRRFYLDDGAAGLAICEHCLEGYLRGETA